MTTPKKLLSRILGLVMELTGAFFVLLVPAALFALKFQSYQDPTPVMLFGVLGIGFTAVAHLLRMQALGATSSPDLLPKKSPGFANVVMALIGAVLFVAGALVGSFFVWLGGILFLVMGSSLAAVCCANVRSNTVKNPLDRVLWMDSVIFGLGLLGLASLLASPILLAVAPNQWRLPALTAAAAAAAWMLRSILKKQPKS